MRRFLTIILLLAASSLQAAVQVKVDSVKVATPAGYVEVDGARTVAGKVFSKIGEPNKHVAIVGTSPIHYADSAAGWVEFDPAITNISSGIYTHRVRPSNRFGIDWNDDGAIRYLAYGANSGLLLGGIEFLPTFDQTNIDIQFTLSNDGIKADYILLNASAPDSLTWTWKAKATANWNGEVTKAKLAAWLDGKILYPTAFDANGDSVGVIRTKTAGAVEGDSLMGTMTYFVQTGGATYPIDVDPTVNDTVDFAGYSNYTGRSSNATFLTARNETNANSSMFVPPAIRVGVVASGGVYYNNRAWLPFPMDDLPAATVVDSAFLWTRGYSAFADSTTWMMALLGNFTRADTTKTIWNDIAGINTNTPWDSVVILADSARTSASDSVLTFTAAGRDSLVSKMGNADTLRVMLVDTREFRGGSDVADASARSIFSSAYLVIYYSFGNPPGVSMTVQDSVLYRIPLFGVIDSTGGANLTSRGFQYFMLGDNADTVTVTDTTGSYPASEFALMSDSLVAVDTSIVVRAWGSTPSFTSYSAWDTISTTAGSGGSTVYDTTYITTSSSGPFGSGKFD